MASNERVRAESASLSLLADEVARVIVGQKYIIDRLLISLSADGHVLREGAPGLAETTAIKLQLMEQEIPKLAGIPVVLENLLDVNGPFEAGLKLVRDAFPSEFRIDRAEL